MATVMTAVKVLSSLRATWVQTAQIVAHAEAHRTTMAMATQSPPTHYPRPLALQQIHPLALSLVSRRRHQQVSLLLRVQVRRHHCLRRCKTKAQTSIQPTKEVAGEEATDLAFRGTTSLMQEEEEAAEAAAEEAAEAAARERQTPGTTFLLEPMGRRTAR